MERDDLPLREDWVREEERRRTTYLAFHLPLLAVFNVPPVAALVATTGALTSDGLWALWAVGAVFTASALAYWLLVFMNPAVGTYLGLPPARPGQAPVRAE